MTATDLKTVKVLGQTSEELSLSKREKHLIGLAVTLTRGCTACTNRRYKEALNDGITKKELIEMTDLVALTNAGVVARTALSSWDEENDDCIDGACSVK
ncbi:carboxymuconolactone decarboxylase family protein [Poseidonibacter lekithochrous]|uniref:carboxymuconolactone decarboxylase family protein n=1 Tax=Poseidonibacter lekithochrous TaxID=1904463 RepID=UPI0008FC8B20|nr:carboxymuconolactone decarboxylase family protein [Poseidonibacter lekithochrous]QKJ22866.1 carboxymuconolactone decarboxylase family protein [Poseidonibacter lekithochrous]